MKQKYPFDQRALQRLMDDRGYDHRRLGGHNRPVKGEDQNGNPVYRIEFAYITPSPTGGVWGGDSQIRYFLVDRSTLIRAIQNPLGCQWEPKKSITWI